MKNSLIKNVQRLALFITLNFWIVSAIAQDSASQTTTTHTTNATTKADSTVQPWMFIVGAIVVLILVIVFVNTRKTNTTVTRTTVYKNED